MNKKHTMTLSRWHKVAERLSREHNEAVNKAKKVLTDTKVAAYVGESQEQLLRDEAADSMERLERAFRFQDAVAVIRSALGDENVRAGVTAQLAELDKLNRRQRVLAEIVEGQASDMIGIGELKNIPEGYVSDDSLLDQKRPKLRIRALERGDMLRFQEELERGRVKAYALSDELAERNKTTLSIELAEEVAHAAGL